MPQTEQTMQQLLEAVTALRQDFARLADRVVTLESQVGAISGVVQDRRSIPQIDEQTLSVISAAIAAYLGVTPHIRQVRLIGSMSWLQNGRATIQASHNLQVQHR
ncbi:MAG: hypothetical protein R3E01_26700 [Pirellulaceae bacterium]|nr:hypothetical protein [Planctomycetales bacterium]